MLGALLILLPGPVGPAFISPGPLTFKHGISTEKKDCAICHTAVHLSPASLVSRVFASGTGMKESQLCLNCHQLGENGLQIHSRSPEELKAVTNKIKQVTTNNQKPFFLTLFPGVVGVPTSPAEPLSCATCHSEHQGKNFNLQSMGNQECQTCHVQKFSSLSNGHPPFSQYPSAQGKSIIFDHNTHMGKHFKGDDQEKAPTDCLACHRLDSQGQSILLRGFETACAACHTDEILGAKRTTAKGIPFFRLPGLDMDTLKEYGYPVGEWPADLNFEEGLTPFMKLLLVGDPEVAENLNLLSEFDYLTELEDAEEEEIQAASKVIWAIKELFYDILSGGQKSIADRLQKAMKPSSNSDELPARELAAFARQIPREVIQGAQQKWFPNLKEEVRNNKKTGVLEEKGSDKFSEEFQIQDPEREDWVSSGGWYFQDQDFSILYRPGYHGDRVLQTWLDMGRRYSKDPALIPVKDMFTELSDPKAPGVCMKCHTVRESTQEISRVHWSANQPSTYRHTSTRFVHSPHFNVMQNKGCIACHQPNTKTNDAEGTEKQNAPSGMSDFIHMTKSTCGACHTNEAAGDGCLTCHNYHVGDITPKVSVNPLFVPSLSILQTKP